MLWVELNKREISRYVMKIQADETGQAGHALNGLLERQQSAISQINSVMAAVAAGDFSHRVDLPLAGDFNALKQATNDSADSVAATMDSLAQVMASLSSGDFSARMTGNIEAIFVNRLMERWLIWKQHWVKLVK